MYVHRTLEPFLEQASGHFPVLLVTGARQVGKTTLLRYMEGERTYVTLDDPSVRMLAREDPALFFQRFEPPLLIDEIQYAPQLLPYIKMAVDQGGEPGMFWLTGSQQFHLMKGVSETLAGRVGVVGLLGFSLREMERGHDREPFLPEPDRIAERAKGRKPLRLKEVYRRIWRGSFPAIVLNEDMDRDLFFGSYVQTYLERDIRDLAQVGDEGAFLRFLRSAAARTGQILNVADMARDAGVSHNTANGWLSLLQTTDMVFLLEPYSNNALRRMIKRPKMYFLDTGLCAYLTRWSNPETLEAGAMSGAILETWVVSEVIKSYRHNGKSAPLFYFRDRDGREIDLLIEMNGRLHPLEIKKSAAPGKGDIRHFGILERAGVPVGPGGVICMAATCLPLTGTHGVIPLAAL